MCTRVFCICHGDVTREAENVGWLYGPKTGYGRLMRGTGCHFFLHEIQYSDQVQYFCRLTFQHS